MAPGKSGKVSKPRGWEEITRKDELRTVRRAQTGARLTGTVRIRDSDIKLT